MRMTQEDIFRFWAKVKRPSYGECWEWQADILTARCSARALGRKYNVDNKTIRQIQKEFSLCPSQE